MAIQAASGTALVQYSIICPMITQQNQNNHPEAAPIDGEIKPEAKKVIGNRYICDHFTKRLSNRINNTCNEDICNQNINRTRFI